MSNFFDFKFSITTTYVYYTLNLIYEIIHLYFLNILFKIVALNGFIFRILFRKLYFKKDFIQNREIHKNFI